MSRPLVLDRFCRKAIPGPDLRRVHPSCIDYACRRTWPWYRQRHDQWRMVCSGRPNKYLSANRFGLKMSLHTTELATLHITEAMSSPGDKWHWSLSQWTLPLMVATIFNWSIMALKSLKKPILTISILLVYNGACLQQFWQIISLSHAQYPTKKLKLQ